jgi:hypothetical protein
VYCDNAQRRVMRIFLNHELRNVRNSFTACRWRGCARSDRTPDKRAIVLCLSGSNHCDKSGYCGDS